MKTQEVKVVVIEAEPPKCPGCGKTVNATAGSAIPKAGDWDICYGCFAVSRFTGGPAEPRRLALADELEATIASGELDAKDGDLLRMCMAEHARSKGRHA